MVSCGSGTCVLCPTTFEVKMVLTWARVFPSNFIASSDSKAFGLGCEASCLILFESITNLLLSSANLSESDIVIFPNDVIKLVSIFWSKKILYIGIPYKNKIDRQHREEPCGSSLCIILTLNVGSSRSLCLYYQILFQYYLELHLRFSLQMSSSDQPTKPYLRIPSP